MQSLFQFAMFLTSASPVPSGEEVVGSGNDILSLLMTFGPLLLIVVAFYFFLMRPENKRKKETAKMRSELIVGDEVTTVGGIIGKIVSIKDETVTIETGAEKSRIRVMRWAVSGKTTKETSE